MRAYEFITESGFDKGIEEVLLSKGYEFLGSGVDQEAYLEPGTGMVLKIFGTGDGSATSFTKSQQSFIDFANFCMKNPNNQFLPYFDGWERFEFDKEYYLQIRVERMFEAEPYLGNGGDVLEMMVYDAMGNGYKSFGEWYDKKSKEFADYYSDDNYIDRLNELVMLIGSEQECNLLWNTIRQLHKLAQNKGYTLDLHRDNFMLGGDGEIIINDPFWVGTSWSLNE